MRPHLIHHTAPRHAAALPGLIPDHGPEPLPRERRSWRAEALAFLELVLFVIGLHPGAEDSPLDDGADTALQTPGAQLGPVRPAHSWPHLPAIPALAGRILHRGPRPASAAGLGPATVCVVPTVPTAAGPMWAPDDELQQYFAVEQGNALGVPLLGVPLVPVSRYLPGEDPRSTTQQLHALTETALAALDLHYRAVDEACDALDALALTPLPSEAPPALQADVGFAPGTRRAPGYDWLAVEPQARGAESRGRHGAGRIAADVVIGGRL